MATYTTYTDGSSITAVSGGNAAGFPANSVIEGVFDASERNLAAADVVTVVNLPAGTYVRNVFYEVLNADGSQTMNVGDGDDPDGYVAAAAVGTAGASGVGGGVLAGGKYYADADTIDIEVPGTMAFDTLKVRIIVDAVVVGLHG